MKKIKANFISANIRNNEIFKTNSPGNRDNCYLPFILLKKELERINIELNTPDINRTEPIYFEIHLDSHKITETSTTPRYLIAYESPIHKPSNNNEKHLNKFRKVFTWNDNIVNNKTILKLHYPVHFPENTIHIDGWEKRDKFCCLIASNKSSPDKNTTQLYSERINTIRWFEEFHPTTFDLYGHGWHLPPAKPGLANKLIKRIGNLFQKYNTTIHFPSYKGKIENKVDILKQYRYNICYENISEFPGYITEKIWDTFFAGCVPIYWGAPNITDYIDEDCFIDRRRFSNNKELYSFIASITEEQYLRYQQRIANFLSSKKSETFKCETFARIITSTIIQDLQNTSKIKTN